MKHTRKNKKRAPYSGSRAADPSCRHGGGCDWCENNRQVASTRPDNILPEVGRDICCRDHDDSPVFMRMMIVCPVCHNKRCPKAQFCEFKCTGSNAPGQLGKYE
jgi:hypothetical protein